MTEFVDQTIFMPRVYLDAWLTALRSGEFKQGEGTMYRECENEYCCLGVLVRAVDGVNPRSGPHPSKEWLRSRGMRFLAYGNPSQGQPYVETNVPYLPTLFSMATEANDGLRLPFPAIADAIEACAVAE